MYLISLTAEECGVLKVHLAAFEDSVSLLSKLPDGGGTVLTMTDEEWEVADDAMAYEMEDDDASFCEVLWRRITDLRRL